MLKPVLMAGFREWLAGKARAENIVFRDRVRVNLTDVPGAVHVEVLLVENSQRLVNFAGEDASMTQVAQSEVESPQPGEEVYEAQCSTRGTRELDISGLCIPKTVSIHLMT